MRKFAFAAIAFSTAAIAQNVGMDDLVGARAASAAMRTANATFSGP